MFSFSLYLKYSQLKVETQPNQVGLLHIELGITSSFNPLVIDMHHGKQLHIKVNQSMTTIYIYFAKL